MSLLRLLLLFLTLSKKVGGYIKRNLFLVDKSKKFIGFKDTPYFQKKKVKYLIFKKKEEDIEKYIPYIYRDIAPRLKDLADEEYSYKDLLNVYFPETVENEKKAQREEKKKKKRKGIVENKTKEKEETDEKKKDNYEKDGEEKSGNESNGLTEDASLIDTSMKNEKICDSEELSIERKKENNNKTLKQMSELQDSEAKNKLLDATYKEIEQSLQKVYFKKKGYKEKEKEKEKEEEKEEEEEEEEESVNFYELAKQDNELLDKNILNNYSFVNTSGTFDFFGPFYNHENYKNPKKIYEEIEKILSLEPLKSSENRLIEDIEFLLKKKIPTEAKNFLLKYKAIGKKIYNFRSHPNYRKKKMFLIESEINKNNKIKADQGTLKNEDEKEEEKEKEKEKEEIKNDYKEVLKDANKIIMMAHKNLENENLLKEKYMHLDQFYEIYKKHLKHMYIKKNKLEPQKNNYDFLTFMHQYFDDYNFLYQDNFTYDFNMKLREAQEKFAKEKEKPNITKEEKEVEEGRNIKDSATKKFYFKPKEEKEILKRFLLKDIKEEYNKKMYNTYKPTNLITDAYGYNSYIDMKNHEKEINLLYNKYSILDYNNKDLSKNNEGFYVGKLIYGKIFDIEKKIAYVDIGYAFYAEIHIDQMPYNITDIRKVFKKNDTVIFEIYKMYKNKILLTLKNIQKINDLNKILHFKIHDIPFLVHVTSVLKNGITVSYNDIFSFIHISALSNKYKVKVGEEGKEDIGEKVDERILNTDIKVLCTDIKKLNFSNLLYEQNEQLKKLRLYTIIETTVIHISKIGLLIRFNDIVGLMHISEISRKKIPNINNLFKINEKIKGVVVNIDYDNKRFSISTKILETHGRNMLEHRQQIYKDINKIVSNIQQRQSALKINNNNVKNQLLSLMDLYKNGEKEKEGNREKEKEGNREKDKENIETKEQWGVIDTSSDGDLRVKKKQTLKEDITKHKIEIIDQQIGKYMKTENEVDNNTLEEIYKTEIDKEEDTKMLPINANNEMITYLLLKSEEYNKPEIQEEKQPIVWNLEDKKFMSSNSPSQNTQFLEYQWSFQKEKKWINFSFYVNRIINYYFSINDDIFTYEEKNVLYEINFVKNVRTDLNSGNYTKIRKTFLK